jgi:hypothetical protein
MFWNENTFDVYSILFTKQAYEEKKYAFVSDYVRVKVLYEYGGIYFDTDVEIVKDFNEILATNNCFVGFETKVHVGTAVMGFYAKHSLIENFIKYYENQPFINKNGNMNNIANVAVLTDLLIKSGLQTGGAFQTINDIDIYFREYFYPKKISETEFRTTPVTLAIHKCSNSWMTDRERKRGQNKLWINIVRPILRSFRTFGLNFIGERLIRKIEIQIRNILK